MKLGRIKQVELREIWKHEATNFTTWLALPENLEMLAEEIDIELSLINTEYNVGRFNVDIYAEEQNSDRKVIIENQLEKTDHDHLGKLITYASNLDAEIIIWIVKQTLDEHQKAIEWLNENTDEKLNFFLIRMEVWQIAESVPAPKFHIISKPNDWTKSLKQSVKNVELSETKLLQLKFWEAFKDHVIKNNINLRLRKAHAQHWFEMSLGRAECRISLTINSQKNEFGCEIYISDSEETFLQFSANKEAINSEIPKLEWMALPDKKASRIKKTTKGKFTDETKWNDSINWLAVNALKFQEVFSKF